MLSPTADTIRIFVHVLAATIWVGGQIVLAGLVRPLRQVAPDATRVAARAFNRLAWPAFAILVATGVWNLVDVDVGSTTAYQVTVMVKLVLVAATGGGAAVHSLGRSKAALAVGGALAAIGALGAVFVGALLAEH